MTDWAEWNELSFEDRVAAYILVTMYSADNFDVTINLEDLRRQMVAQFKIEENEQKLISLKGEEAIADGKVQVAKTDLESASHDKAEKGKILEDAIKEKKRIQKKSIQSQPRSATEEEGSIKPCTINIRSGLKAWERKFYIVLSLRV